jgi:hypothetical protein
MLASGSQGTNSTKFIAMLQTGEKHGGGGVYALGHKPDTGSNALFSSKGRAESLNGPCFLDTPTPRLYHPGHPNRTHERRPGRP